MDSDVEKAHVAFEVMKEFNDSHLSLKAGGGTYNVSWMQSLNKNLVAGFEMFYIVRTFLI
jgi:hypothetical protein